MIWGWVSHLCRTYEAARGRILAEPIAGSEKTHVGQQLCWLADGLPEYLLRRARELVDDARKRAAAAGTAAPTVVSVSQADNMSPCTSGADGAATDDEGSAMAPLLRTVNFVARGLAASHPGVAVDTLAY